MPKYDFLNTVTNEVEEHQMSYTALDEFLTKNPQLVRHFSAENMPNFGDRKRTASSSGGIVSQYKCRAKNCKC